MADSKNLEGQRFDPDHLKGSGSILPGGEVVPTLPDPTEVRGLGGNRTSGGRLVRFDTVERQSETESAAAPKKAAAPKAAPKN